MKKENKRPYLCITIRGEYYFVNSKGEMTSSKMFSENKKPFTGDWLFVGVGTHHQNRVPKISFEEVWKNPSKALGGYLFDLDYGTLRCWDGSYGGSIPRITNIFLINK